MPKIDVFIRVRPLPNPSTQLPDPSSSHIHLSPCSNQIKVLSDHNYKAKHFHFDAVFDDSTTQQELFRRCNIDNMIEKVLQGYNSSILAYGQTGAGKTFTMQGSDLPEWNQSMGVVPRVMRGLFQKMEGDSREYRVGLTFVQIYKEKIFDLLNKKCENPHGLRLRWNKLQQFIVEKVKVKQCISLEEAMKVYHKGASKRIIGKHRMNNSSSRSHTILTIKVESWKNEFPENILTSKFCLVDLAGSEKQELTGTVGRQFKEAVEINKSLFTLRQVITALVDQSKTKDNPPSAEDSFIPYRDSKLTCLLKQSFGGNNFTAMIACLNPGDEYLEESIQTLTYASMTNKIKNIPVRGEDHRTVEINQLKEELRGVNAQLERANQHIQTLTTIIEEKCTKIQEIRGEESSFASTTINKLNLSLDCPIIPMISLPKPFEPQLETRSLGKTFADSPHHSRASYMLQSLSMVKELVNANMNLRSNVEELSKSLDSREKELYELMRENQRLRERWELYSSNMVDESKRTLGESMTAEKILERVQETNFNHRRLNSLQLHILGSEKEPSLSQKKHVSKSREQSKAKETQNLRLSYNQFMNSRHPLNSNGKRDKHRKYTAF